MKNKWFDLRSLWEDISSGNHSDALLGHLSESGLPDELKLEALAIAAENAAIRKSEEAKIVSASTSGVESLSGGASFETERALKLRDLANFFRSLKK